MALRVIALLCLGIGMFGCSTASDPPESTVDPKLSSIQTEIFDARCSCHQVLDPPQARLDLNKGSAYLNLVNRKIEANSERYLFRVRPGLPDSSFLLAKITGDLQPEEGDRMPSHLDVLSDQDIAAIRQWIANGALND